MVQGINFLIELMERRVRGNPHARCEVGENLEITSKSYLSQQSTYPKYAKRLWGGTHTTFPELRNIQNHCLQYPHIHFSLMPEI